METNFFQQIADLNLTGIIKMVIAKTDSGQLAVTLLLVNNQCGDNARNVIPPIQLKESPAELDKGFFNLVGQPIQVTNQIFLNMESYLKKQEEAVKKSKMTKDNNSKDKTSTPPQPAKTEREKKYEAAMKKVQELEAQNKFREAWCNVPDPLEYPKMAEELRKKKEQLHNRFEPSLF